MTTMTSMEAKTPCILPSNLYVIICTYDLKFSLKVNALGSPFSSEVAWMLMTSYIVANA